MKEVSAGAIGEWMTHSRAKEGRVDDWLLSLFRWNCWQDGTERHDGARCIFAGHIVPCVSRSYPRGPSPKSIFSTPFSDSDVGWISRSIIHMTRPYSDPSARHIQRGSAASQSRRREARTEAGEKRKGEAGKGKRKTSYDGLVEA